MTTFNVNGTSSSEEAIEKKEKTLSSELFCFLSSQHQTAVTLD